MCLFITGNYNKQLFILQSHNGMKSLEWKSIDKNQPFTPLQVGWQPYLSTGIALIILYELEVTKNWLLIN